jgi:hypothetical protein
LFKLSVLAGFIIFTTVASGVAGSAGSASYSMDYVLIGNSGGVTSSAAYSAMALVQMHGVVPRTVSSGSYSVQPVIGTGSDTTTVFDWQLY